MFAADILAEAVSGSTVIVCDKAGVPSTVTVALAILLGSTTGVITDKALFKNGIKIDDNVRYKKYWDDVVNGKYDIPYGMTSEEYVQYLKGLDNVDKAIKEASDVIKGGSKTISELLKETACNNDELYKYLSKNVGTEAAENFIRNGKWPDGIQIPKNSSVLNADGSINWNAAAKGGYVLDSNGNAIKTSLTDSNKINEYLPEGKIIDRYGDSGGRYVSPVNNGGLYTYGQRSLPYIEDASNYHQYEVTGDFTKLEEYINNCSDNTLKNEILGDIDFYYNGDFDKVIVNVGEIAKVDGWGTGGGIQYEFPIKVEYLEKLGLLKEIK
jgi:hypothetical protein